MVQRFLGKIVVVIGGNSGIGLASAKAFAQEGAQIVITGRNQETLRQAEQDIGTGVVALRSDTSDLRQITALYADIRKRFGRIDVLFVNAGILSYRPIASVTEEDWDSVQSVNLKGAFFNVQQALNLMKMGSCIILTGSTAGRKAVPTTAVYGATKAGVRSLGRTLAAELLDLGIRVNVVSPGPIETPICHRYGTVDWGAVPPFCRFEVETMPMKRKGTPEEVAAAVLFLASDAASFINGVDFLVDSGVGSF